MIMHKICKDWDIGILRCIRMKQAEWESLWLKKLTNDFHSQGKIVGIVIIT